MIVAQHSMQSVADTGGSLGQLPPQTSVAPLFGAHGSRKRFKNTLKQYFLRG